MVSISELLMLKEQIRRQVNHIILQEGNAWFDITDKERLLQQCLMCAVKDNNESVILIVAREYAGLLVNKEIIRKELEAKYGPQLTQMKSIDQLTQMKSIDQQLKQKMN
jgi:hypothetical protein